MTVKETLHTQTGCASPSARALAGPATGARPRTLVLSFSGPAIPWASALLLPEELQQVVVVGGEDQRGPAPSGLGWTAALAGSDVLPRSRVDLHQAVLEEAGLAAALRCREEARVTDAVSPPPLSPRHEGIV